MHRVLCADITQGDPLAEVSNGLLADVTYTDPPWGGALLKWFYTHKGGDRCPVTWSEFISKFAELVRRHTKKDGHFFVEMGEAWVDDLAVAMSQVGIQESNRWSVTYGRPKRPSVLWYSGPGKLIGNPSGLHGQAVPKWALSQVVRRGVVVMDPCCGKGTTAKFTKSFGGTFWGTELNPKRLAVTRSILEK